MARLVNLVMEDDLGLIVRSHIILEAGLNFLLQPFGGPGTELDRLSFMAKVDVGVALGRLTPDLRPGFAEVNKLRNRFAHDLDATLSRSDAESVIDSLPDRFEVLFAGQPEMDVRDQIGPLIL